MSIVLDASPTNRKRRCDDLELLLVEAMASSADADLVLMLYATSHAGGGNGLDELGRFERPQRPLRTTAAGDSNDHDADARALLQQATEACASMNDRFESPIFQAAQFALSNLAQSGCGTDPDLHCRLVIRTDGFEEKDPVLLAALAGEPPKDRKPRLSEPGVTVELCGLSQIEVRRGAKTHDFDTVRTAWLPELGKRCRRGGSSRAARRRPATRLV